MSSSKGSKRSLNEDIFSNKIRKRTVNPNEEVTQFEELSNEILYEIFDYLDASDIFYGFLSLNIRFDRLIKHSFLPIKLTRSATFDDITNVHYRQLINTNKHRIISLYLKDTSHLSYFTTLLVKHELFNRLECIALEKMQYENLTLLLPHLRILPRLFSLKIEVRIVAENLAELYPLIGSLPVLKYNKVSVTGSLFPLFAPTNTDQISSLEQLVLNFPCSIGVLETILPYTPQLNHLSCTRLVAPRFNNLKMPINLAHLRSVFIKDSYLSFDTFETFAREFFPRIEILHFVTTHDNAYIDANRWERLILKNIPRLRIFNFNCFTITGSQNLLDAYLLPINRFISSFWIERKWFLEIQFSPCFVAGTAINCAIKPLKKQWYELPTITRQKHLNIPVLRLNLKIEESQLSVNYPTLERYVCSLDSSIQFTNFQINLYQFSMTILLQYLHRLPNLDSLTIRSKFSEINKTVSIEQSDMFRMVSTHNKITKLNIEQMTELDQVHLLLVLCPNLHYFQLTCRNISDAEWLIRYVLSKQNANFIPYLCLICISLSNADEIITNRLQKIIDNEKLVEHYKIFRICDRIYLQWNEHF